MSAQGDERGPAGDPVTTGAAGTDHARVIAREERYLEAKFGDAYRAYKARVRRWL